MNMLQTKFAKTC